MASCSKRPRSQTQSATAAKRPKEQAETPNTKTFRGLVVVPGSHAEDIFGRENVAREPNEDNRLELTMANLSKEKCYVLSNFYSNFWLIFGKL